MKSLLQRSARATGKRAAPTRSPGRISKLAYLMHDNPSLYADMLSFLRPGAYLHVAAALVELAKAGIGLPSEAPADQPYLPYLGLAAENRPENAESLPELFPKNRGGSVMPAATSVSER